MRLQLDQIPSPIGVIRLVSDEEGRLRALDFEDAQRAISLCCADTTAQRR